MLYEINFVILNCYKGFQMFQINENHGIGTRCWSNNVWQWFKGNIELICDQYGILVQFCHAYGFLVSIFYNTNYVQILA